MADQTNTHIDPPFPPAVLSGAELYDSIMGQIEPELVSAKLPFSPDLFAAESPEQRAARAERYQAAFDEFDRRFAAYQDQWNEELRTYKRHAMTFIEEKADAEEQNTMASIESSLNSDI